MIAVALRQYYSSIMAQASNGYDPGKSRVPCSIGLRDKSHRSTNAVMHIRFPTRGIPITWPVPLRQYRHSRTTAVVDIAPLAVALILINPSIML